MPRYTDPTRPQYGPVGGDLPAEHRASRSNRERLGILVLGVALAAVILAFVGVMLREGNVLPAGIPIIGKDSGLAACEVISKAAANGSGDSSPAAAFGGDDRTALRKVFSGSRYPEIRDPGVRFVDLAMQLDGMGDDAGLAALPLVGPLTESYAALAGGCAEHGYTLPNLFGK